MPQFDIAVFSSQIFWLVIFFTILMAYTVTISVPSMRNLLDERWERTDGFRLSADRYRDESKDLEKQKSDLVKQARANAQNLLSVEQEKIKERFVSDTKAITARFEKEFAEKEQAFVTELNDQMTESRDYAVHVTQSIIDKMLGLSMDEGDIMKHINDNVKKDIAK